MTHPTIEVENRTDNAGNPAGGTVRGLGIAIDWHDGSNQEGSVEQNGAFVETVLLACRRRLEYYQRTRYQCEENAEAINHVDSAIEAIQRRLRRRREAGVEGRHETMPGEGAAELDAE